MRKNGINLGTKLALSLACCSMLTGCLVAGYSSGGGFWIWPGSIVITLSLLALWFFTRR